MEASLEAKVDRLEKDILFLKASSTFLFNEESREYIISAMNYLTTHPQRIAVEQFYQSVKATVIKNLRLAWSNTLALPSAGAGSNIIHGLDHLLSWTASGVAFSPEPILSGCINLVSEINRQFKDHITEAHANNLRALAPDSTAETMTFIANVFALTLVLALEDKILNKEEPSSTAGPDKTKIGKAISKVADKVEDVKEKIKDAVLPGEIIDRRSEYGHLGEQYAVAFLRIIMANKGPFSVDGLMPEGMSKFSWKNFRLFLTAYTRDFDYINSEETIETKLKISSPDSSVNDTKSNTRATGTNVNNWTMSMAKRELPMEATKCISIDKTLLQRQITFGEAVTLIHGMMDSSKYEIKVTSTFPYCCYESINSVLQGHRKTKPPYVAGVEIWETMQYFHLTCDENIEKLLNKLGPSTTIDSKYAIRSALFFDTGAAKESASNLAADEPPSAKDHA